MGNQKQKWTAEEEDALLAGISKHGPGKWKNILKDPEFAPHLIQRSNIDLKDKWRNLSVSSSGQGTREKSRAPKLKAAAIALAAAGTRPAVATGTPPAMATGTPPAVAAGTPSIASLTPNAPNSAPIASLVSNGPSPMAIDDLSNNAMDAKNTPRYNAMVFDAISTINNVNGADIVGIFNYIEKRHEIPQNFRRLLGSRLRRLVSQGKLKKVDNCYKICDDATTATKAASAPKHFTKSHLQSTPPVSAAVEETQEEAAMAAAYKVAEAENKSFLAAEAVKEAERVAKLAEDSNSMLQIAMEIYEQCARGEKVFVG